MRRTRNLVLGLYLTILTTSAYGQAATSPRRIGFLVGSTPAAAQFQVDCFAAELKDRKWIEGNTLLTEYQWTGGTPERSAELAAELVRSKPDIIIATGTVAGQAAHKATKNIPIVFAALTDPIDAGLVQSFARPGGNVTGISNYFSGTTAKLVDLLLAIAPGKKSFGVIYNPANPAKRVEMAELTPMVRSLGGAVIPLEMRTLNPLLPPLGSLTPL
jgi:putative tryptophan/tyrosine transport system substrate-binding protein